LPPRLAAIDELGGGWGNFTKQITDGKMTRNTNIWRICTLQSIE